MLFLFAIQIAISIAGRFALYIGLPIMAAYMVFEASRFVYHYFNPAAKQLALEKTAKMDEARLASKVRETHLKVEAAKQRQVEAERQQREIDRIERLRQMYRDAPYQEEPYTYHIDKHANEALAIRYGIANQTRRTIPYWFTATGGVQKRNPSRDTFHFVDAEIIRLQKTKQIELDLYEVVLTDYRNRPAKAIIEQGKEYVKTFYPYDDDWFKKHGEFDRSLKGNETFSLKELAAFYVQRIATGKVDS